MEFNNKFDFEWGDGESAEPSAELKGKGFTAGYKPPAGVFNWFWSKVIKAITELQSKFGSHADDKFNPHDVTAAQLGLDKVNNTADSEKSVKFASEAGVGRKVAYPFLFRLNGGQEEGTDLWTYDGSTSRSVNLTPAKLGAAKSDHEHTFDEIKETANRKAEYFADAISEDGALYTATVAEITELYNGLTITIIPNMTSTKAAVQFNLNGFGAKNVRAKINGYNSGNSGTLAAFASWVGENAPLTIRYFSKFDSWQTVDFSRPSTSGLYGTVDIEQGGTGGSTAETARTNLEVAQAIEDSTYKGCYYRMVDGVQEWINPPLATQTHYKTAERYQGKPVYAYALRQTNVEPNAYSGIRCDLTPTRIISATGIVHREDGTSHPLDSSVTLKITQNASDSSVTEIQVRNVCGETISTDMVIKYIV